MTKVFIEQPRLNRSVNHNVPSVQYINTYYHAVLYLMFCSRVDLNALVLSRAQSENILSLFSGHWTVFSLQLLDTVKYL